MLFTQQIIVFQHQLDKLGSVNAAYLPPDMQHILVEEMEIFDCTPSYSQAVCLHRAANVGVLDIELIEAILAEPKANQQEHIRLKRESFAKYFPSHYTPAQIEQDSEAVTMAEKEAAIACF